MIMPVSIRFDHVSPKLSKWTILSTLWSNNSVSFIEDSDGWRIKEVINIDTFSLRRDYVTGNRYTDVDMFGLLGLSLLDIKDTEVYITEGVSDFFTTKLILPNKNVLGVTQLGGSFTAKKLLVSLFNTVHIVADNDTAGILNASKWKRFLNSYGVSADVWQPSIGKDITDEFLFNYKQNERVQF